MTSSTPRGWDTFLSEADHALLASTSWAKTGPFGLGRRPAVVLVDVYRGALGHRGAERDRTLADYPSACGPSAWAAVDEMVRIIAVARAAAVPVVHVTGLAFNPSPWNRKYSPTSSRPPRRPDHLAIVAEVAPLAGELVLEKASPSAFATTPLAGLLRVAGVDTVVVCGEATSGCVRSTVVDACVEGFRVAVPEAACFDRFEASHWTSLFDLDQKYADVVDTPTTLTYLKEVPR